MNNVVILGYFYCFFGGPHTIVFRAYSWLCSKGPLLAASGMPGIIPGSEVCKASALLIVLLFLLLDNISLGKSNDSRISIGTSNKTRGVKNDLDVSDALNSAYLRFQ